MSRAAFAAILAILVAWALPWGAVPVDSTAKPLPALVSPATRTAAPPTVPVRDTAILPVDTSALPSAAADTSIDGSIYDTEFVSTPQSDSLRVWRADSAANAQGKGKRKAPRHYGLKVPAAAQYACDESAEQVGECLRGQGPWVMLGQGFPGTRAQVFDASRWEALPWSSPYMPNAAFSPYGSGGMRLPERVRSEGPDFSPTAYGEAWSPIAPLDTPLTRLQWQRGALAFNQFQVDLERALMGGSYVAMSYSSQSADSQTFKYSFNVHQPYLSGWGFLGKLYAPIDRDSSSLPLEGLAPKVEANHMRPRLGFWLDTNQVVEVFYDRVRNRSHLPLPYNAAQNDSLFAPLVSQYGSDAFGLLYAGEKGPWHYSASLTRGSAESDLTTVILRDTATGNPADTAAKAILLGKALHESVVNSAEGHLAWRKDSLHMLAKVFGESEELTGPLLLFRGLGDSSGWRDGQGVNGEARYGLSHGRVAAGGGFQRESRASNRIDYLPDAWMESHWTLPWGFAVGGGALTRRENPEGARLYHEDRVLNRLATPDLRPRWDQGLQGRVAWDSPRLGFYLGFDGHWLQDNWAPRVLPSPQACGDLAAGQYATLSARCGDSVLLADTLALRWRNYDQEIRQQALLGLRLQAGNWRLWLENRFLLRDDMDDADFTQGPVANLATPERVFRGQLLWTRRLVSDRLRVITRWDWEWVSTRYAWASRMDGNAGLTKLDEYLMLDFYAAMQVKTFTLHFRTSNMNHDRYAPEPGVHPPGVNFRFGVDWAMLN